MLTVKLLQNLLPFVLCCFVLLSLLTCKLEILVLFLCSLGQRCSKSMDCPLKSSHQEGRGSSLLRNPHSAQTRQGECKMVTGKNSASCSLDDGSLAVIYEQFSLTDVLVAYIVNKNKLESCASNFYMNNFFLEPALLTYGESDRCDRCESLWKTDALLERRNIFPLDKVCGHTNPPK